MYVVLCIKLKLSRNTARNKVLCVILSAVRGFLFFSVSVHCSLCHCYFTTGNTFSALHHCHYMTPLHPISPFVALALS